MQHEQLFGSLPAKQGLGNIKVRIRFSGSGASLSYVIGRKQKKFSSCTPNEHSWKGRCDFIFFQGPNYDNESGRTKLVCSFSDLLPEFWFQELACFQFITCHCEERVLLVRLAKQMLRLHRLLYEEKQDTLSNENPATLKIDEQVKDKACLLAATQVRESWRSCILNPTQLMCMPAMPFIHCTLIICCNWQSSLTCCVGCCLGLFRRELRVSQTPELSLECIDSPPRQLRSICMLRALWNKRCRAVLIWIGVFVQTERWFVSRYHEQAARVVGMLFLYGCRPWVEDGRVWPWVRYKSSVNSCALCSLRLVRTSWPWASPPPL